MSQIQKREAIYLASNPRPTAETRARRMILDEVSANQLVKAAVFVSAFSLFAPGVRADVAKIASRLMNPVPAVTNPNLVDLAKHHPNFIKGVQPDPSHSGDTLVTYYFSGPGHDTLWDAANDVAPAQVVPHAVSNLQTYNGSSAVAEIHSQLSFDVDRAGYIVPDPDKS